MTIRLFILALIGLAACSGENEPENLSPKNMRWIAGDHHVHSEFSVGWVHKGILPDNVAPSYLLGGDAPYQISKNVKMARKNGLEWMVSTDHGGPNHSKINFERAYPEIQSVRKANPDVILFYGMEFDTPGADHSSLIMPHTHDEAERLFQIESKFSWKDDYSGGEAVRNTEQRMIDALTEMQSYDIPPVLIANHPGRTIKHNGQYGLVTPEELRRWNNTAPDVSVGMVGAPGHQARVFHIDGTLEPTAPRSSYALSPTMGGYDQLTSRLGGFWDSMLGEGRRWWVTAASDSHRNWRDGGDDFWPGEFAKTYVLAEKSHDSILEGLRAGRIFITTGDLITALGIEVKALETGDAVSIGSELKITKGQGIVIEIRVQDPNQENGNFENPQVSRIDIISGKVNDRTSDTTSDSNETTSVIRRIESDAWRKDGDWIIVEHVIENVQHDFYVRIRGTNTNELEPQPDVLGENPWNDLWFYSNPIFVTTN